MDVDDIENSSAPIGKSRKYARREHERRFLRARGPEGQPVRTVLITDNYRLRTRLRIRRRIDRESRVPFR